MQNPMKEQMQDGTLIVPDDGETQMQLLTLWLDMSRRSYNLVANNSYSLPSGDSRGFQTKYRCSPRTQGCLMNERAKFD